MIKLRLKSFAIKHKCYVGVNSDSSVCASFEKMVWVRGGWFISRGNCFVKHPIADISEYVVRPEEVDIQYSPTGDIL